MTLKVPMKINPGCTIPDIPAVPNVQEYLQVTLPQLAVERLANVVPAAAAEIARVAALADEITSEVTAYQAAFQKRARTLRRLLAIPCPLPQVPDSSLDFDLPGDFNYLDIDNNEQTLGESLFIEPGEDFTPG